MEFSLHLHRLLPHMWDVIIFKSRPSPSSASPSAAMFKSNPGVQFKSMEAIELGKGRDRKECISFPVSISLYRPDLARISSENEAAN
jgi:hypothetical protein